MELNDMMIEKIKKRLEKEKELIEECEASIENIPEGQRETQKKVLEIMKTQCSGLERKLQAED